MRRFAAGLALILSLALPVTGNAAQETIAKQAIIIDMNSGAVLLEKDVNMRMPTASMSKVMTTIVAFEALKNNQVTLTSKFPISEKAWRMQGSKMFVELGSSITLDDLLKGIVIQSGNDATIAVAEGIAGSEDLFVARINAMAEKFGMKNSHFMNASGWPDPNHYSTPHDLAIMAFHLIRDYPQFYKTYFSMPEFTWHGIRQQNRDPLLGKVAGADGIKTGHTEEAGYGLIGSAERQGRRVLMVLSGLSSAKDRQSEGVRLMNWALDSFRIQRVLTANQKLLNIPVVYGVEKAVPVTVLNNVEATVPATLQMRDVTMKAKFMAPLMAPVKAGQSVGTLVVSIPNMPVQEYPLVAGADIERKGWIGLTFDKIIQAAKNK